MPPCEEITPGSLEHVGVETDDRDERCIEREVDAGLGHGRAGKAAGVGRGRRRAGAEVAQEGLQ